MELSRDFHMPTWLRRDEKYIMWYHFIFWIIVTGGLIFEGFNYFVFKHWTPTQVYQEPKWIFLVKTKIPISIL